MRSRLASGAGNFAAATTFAQQAIASARNEHGADPVLDRYRVASAYRLLGDVRRRASDSAGASAAWNAGLRLLPAGVAVERPMEMYERQQLLQSVGRIAEARPLAARLAAIGYHSVI